MEAIFNRLSGVNVSSKAQQAEKKLPVKRKSWLKTFFYKLAHWETWHYHLKYIPLYPAWLWYCLRARSFWFFTPSNPTLTFGGFEGESKKEMYDQLPPGSYPQSIYISLTLSFDEVKVLLAGTTIQYPFAVKPDVGMMGFLFRKIETEEDLRIYHQVMPAAYILQELVQYPLEVSVFYYRMPNEARGSITGFIRKEFLQVTGDGTSTLLELIESYPRVRFRQEEMKSKHKDKLHHIIPANEIYCLSYALNLSRGGRLVNLEAEKDEQLLHVFDELSHYAKHFYYGRYDIKCTSIEDLKQGKNFSILEYNGSGAEPHHVYGNGNTLIQAYGILLHHWKMLYRISVINHRNGIQYWSFKQGWKFLKEAKKHFKVLKQLDTEFPAY
jgi:hypothetical protein